MLTCQQRLLGRLAEVPRAWAWALLFLLSAMGAWLLLSSHGPPLAAHTLAPTQGLSLPTPAFSNCPALGSVPQGCFEVRQACLDARWVVLHGQEYQPANQTAPAQPLPSSLPEVKAGFPYPSDVVGDSNPDYLGLPGQPLPPLVSFRPASQYEPHHVSQPQWSCHVPLILQSPYLFNFAHHLGSAASWLYDRLVVGGSEELAGRAVVAVAMPWEVALPPWAHALLQPMSRHPVTTLADLSGRGSNHSRCFASVLLCDQPHVWPGWRVWQAAQHVVGYWQPQWSDVRLNISWRSSSENVPAAHTQATRDHGTVNRGDSTGASTAGGGATPVRRVWRVLFQTRRLSAADVVVGAHGAGVTNMFFMRPGSAFIETMHPDWDHRFFQNWNNLDPESQVHWWGLLVTDRRLFQPGEHELQQYKAGVKPYGGDWNGMMRDRNLRLPWERLRAVLDQVAQLNGSTAQYRQLAASGGNLIVVAPHGPRWFWRLHHLWQRLLWLLQR